ncbi:putative MFS family arabinose efflux permease [Desulfobotulus alkaliphilus]|uniref:Putative MFS family arabinose efflux permease n=1 Tax=Desulfobotulus alkaliphilus TaxID=622671 RepID=A0A562S6Q8_9BACT|nr:MFS transporter [Desulfobotulus alkaliphilus]TWI76898.1 putative MFS family arabinose efflux permease [Desulfobotulus alkaliphilus]
MLSPVFVTLFFSIFIAVTGVGIVVPLLPVYAHDLGASGLAIGLIFGAFSISRTFLLPFFGRMSDEKGRKPFILAGLFAYGLISFLFIAARGVSDLILIRFLHGAASAMVMPVAQAYIGDITPKGKEGLFMGMFNMSMFISLSLGPLMGGILSARMGMHWAFATMGIMAFTGCMASLFFLPPRSMESGRDRTPDHYPWKALITDPVFSGIFLYRFAYTCGIGMIWCFLPVLAHTRFAMESDAIGILVMSGIFVSGLLNIPMGWLADRWNRKAMVFIGGVLVAAGMAAIGMAEGFSGLLTGCILFGTGGGISVPAMTAMAVETGKSLKAMGGAMSLLTMAHSMGMLVGSLGAGLAMDHMNLSSAFPMAAFFLVTSLLPMAICFRMKKK